MGRSLETISWIYLSTVTSAEHEAQVLGYLKSARIEHGLLINFGSYKFEIRKFARSEPPNRGSFQGAIAVFSALFAFFAVK